MSNKQLQNLDRRTGKELDTDPGYIKNGESTLVLVILTKPLCVETSTEYHFLACSLSIT